MAIFDFFKKTEKKVGPKKKDDVLEKELIEYYCLKCGAILNKQKGFSPESPIFACKKCGNINYGDNLKYPDTIWFCDSCNGLLNNQDGFNPNNLTHKCTNCGYVNDTSDDNLIEEGDYTPEYFIEEYGFKVEGLDLIWEITLTEEEISKGSFEAPTVDGDISVTIPSDYKEGMTLRIKGKGIKGTSENGDLYITIHLPSQTKMSVSNSRKTKNNSNSGLSTMDELDNLIGLSSVKQQLKRMRALLIKSKGSTEPINLHMCFYGNPGTGKTIVARLIANIFYECGILPTNKLIETDRSGLCGKYIGETGPLTHEKVQEAMGGVLFIDEAYTLSNKRQSGNDYGAEAIAALLKDMEDYKGKFCVILAGYKNEMVEMISTNPGFDSRINRKIDFPDYSIDEMEEIFNLHLKKRNYSITIDAMKELKKVFEIYSKRNDFANARTVRNLLDQLIEIQALRTVEDEDSKNDNDTTIELQDIHVLKQENNIL